MPRLYRRKRNYRKKRTYRKRRRPRSNLTSNAGIIPAKQIVKMRYVADGLIDTSVANFVTYSANSIFEPHSGISTHQPYGHDTMATMYRHYTVLGAKITVNFVNDDTTDPTYCIVDLQDTNTSARSANTIREAGRAAYGVLTSAPNGLLRLRKKFSSKNFFNKVDVVDNTQLGAAFGASPDERAFFHVECGSIVAGPNVIVHLVVTIDYIVQLSEPQQLTGS